MARSARSTTLENRTNRGRLPRGKRVWRAIGKGLALGYRRGENAGSWYMRRALPGNRYTIKAIGQADDSVNADGVAVLTFFEAQDRVRELAKAQIRGRGRYTVGDAMKDYIAEVGAKPYTVKTIDGHILPKLKDRKVVELTKTEIASWRNDLAKAPPVRRGKVLEVNAADPEVIRRRRATANRVLTVLKAALNHAFREERVPSDDAWARVKPFAKVDAAKIRYLSAPEAQRLINATDAEFCPLVRAALLTGARFGELTRVKVGDYDQDGGTVLFAHTKSGKPRRVPLTEEGQDFFDQLTAGKAHNDEPMFSRQDGTRWGKGQQQRRMQDACKKAKLSATSFHDLRNTYGALLAMAGTPIKVIAEALGHADTRITEKHYAHLSSSYLADTIRANLPRFGISKGNVTRIDRQVKTRSKLTG
jgi:integrase